MSIFSSVCLESSCYVSVCLYVSVSLSVVTKQSAIGPTVFHRPRNFELSCGICPFSHNFDVAAEFHGNFEK